MGLPFGGIGALLDFARIFYFSVSKNHINASGAAEHPFQYIMFFSPQMQFGELGAFFLHFGTPFFASREDLGRPFWHLGRHPAQSFWCLGSTLGGHFGTSGPPWRTMGAAGWTRSCPRHRILFDFGVISGLVSGSFGGSKCV